MFVIVFENVPIRPLPSVPKAHDVARGVFAITAPRACITSAILCGASSAASVVTVNVSVKGDASLGLATALGIAFGVTVIVVLPPIGIVAGRVVASPESTYGEFAPMPSDSPVMLNCWFPAFETVNVWAGPSLRS